MRRLFYCLIAVTLVLTGFSNPVFALESEPLEIDAAMICREVRNLEPIGVSESFPVTVGKLYCFTQVVGAAMPTMITHVWYFGSQERARVDLHAGAHRWRTYSSKIILPYEIGSWRVEVVDAEGTVLKVIQFLTTSEAQPSVPTPEKPVQNEPAMAPDTESPPAPQPE